VDYYENKTQTRISEQQNGAMHFGKSRYAGIGSRGNPSETSTLIWNVPFAGSPVPRLPAGLSLFAGCVIQRGRAKA
jgi:hypothetical protein